MDSTNPEFVARKLVRDWIESGFETRMLAQIDLIDRIEIALVRSRHGAVIDLLYSNFVPNPGRGWRVADICRHTKLPKETIRGVLDRLLKGGYIERKVGFAGTNATAYYTLSKGESCEKISIPYRRHTSIDLKYSPSTGYRAQSEDGASAARAGNGIALDSEE